MIEMNWDFADVTETQEDLREEEAGPDVRTQPTLRLLSVAESCQEGSDDEALAAQWTAERLSSGL